MSDTNREAYSIAEFCTAHGISRALLSKLRKQGKGPPEKKLGSRVLIPREGASKWLREK